MNGEIDALKSQLSAQRQETELSQSSLSAVKNKLLTAQREVEELKESLATAEANAVAAAALSKANGKLGDM